MNITPMTGRRTLFLTLTLTLVAALVFTLFPQIDLTVSDVFEDSNPAWAFKDSIAFLRTIALWIPWIAMGMVLIALVRQFWQKRMAMARPLIAVLLAFALGPGLLVNGILKSTWHRPRPLLAVEQSEQGDDSAFKAWWDRSGACSTNCSFVSGETAAATMVVAAAALLPLPWTGGAVWLAMLFAVIVAWMRVAFGGHYLSDVIFAALFTQLVVIASHHIVRLFPWPRKSGSA